MSDKRNKNKAEQFFGVFIIIVGLLGLYVLYFEKTDLAQKPEPTKIKVSQNSDLPSKSKLTQLWSKDFDAMKSEGLPPEFKGVWQIKVFMLDKNLHFLLRDLKAPIETNKNGVFNLEVTFISHYSEELKKDMLIIQYNVIDIETDNMILETSRQIVLKDGFLEESSKETEV